MLILFSHALPTILARYHKLPCHGRIGVFSFKKDRGFWLEKLPDSMCRVTEFGFKAETRVVEAGSLAVTLKPVIQLEFPRSFKLHMDLRPAG
ncbi:MAG: hypothetical protein RR101_12050 [Burkholderiaceae bacterium]